jgi:hypothetical protein
MVVPVFLALMAMVQQNDPFQDLDRKKEAAKPPSETPSCLERFFDENFTLKWELFSQFSYSSAEPRGEETVAENTYSRQSAGFEILKKFSSATSTLASLDVQGRLVRRDHFVETIDDTEGAHRKGWWFEYHNLYGDLYNVFDPLLSESGQSENLGRFNFRAGHFYLPFGLNLQTDTHGTLIQLSNDRNFGFERDWYAGLWGSINSVFNYDAYYLVGSGYPLSFRGQSGMAGLRLSLSGQIRNELGLEGGLSFMGGERLSKEAVDRSPSLEEDSRSDRIVDTLRVGLDGRYTMQIPTGSLALTVELSGGRDESDAVFTQLYGLDYLSERRQWGVSVQYRRFWQDIGPGSLSPGGLSPHKTDASIIPEIAWYFRNDMTGAYLHSLRLNVERQLERQTGPKGTIVSIQYYYYW